MVIGKKAWLRYLMLINVALSIWYLIVFLEARGIWFYIVSLSLIISIVFLVLTFIPFKAKIQLPKVILPKSVAWTIAVILALLAAILPFTTPFQIFLHHSGRLLFMVWMTGLGSLLVNHGYPDTSPANAFMFLSLIAGVVYKIGSFLPEIQAVPFSLGWSEGSRYYNASIFFAQRLYGQKIPLPVLHPSRYLLQSIPFIFGSQNILIHRLWQVLLWIVLTALGSLVLARRFKFGSRFNKLALILWFFLYFFQGAVYYHLMVCVILVLLGYHPKKPIRTLVFVVLASVWAGLSRVNWLPLPALLAATLYLLETPVGSMKWFRYFRDPFIWCLAGGATALLTNRLYTLYSGNDPALFTSSFSSGLLWSRLLPNSTYSMGILIGILVVCLPLAVLVVQKIVKTGFKAYWQSVRSLGLCLILFVFLLGGIIVSVKIGGGGDLHNMDAFLVIWIVVALSIIFDHYILESPQNAQHFKLNNAFVILSTMIPVIFSMQATTSWKFISPATQEKDVKLIQSALDVLQDQPGEVLFISERQLLALNKVEGIRLYPEYEKVFLMEMAMSNNQPYLQEFYSLLSQHTFSAILMDPLSTNMQDPSMSFWAENNEWVNRVILPILEDYEPVYTLQNGNVNLLIPRGQSELYNDLINLKSAVQ